MTASEPFGPELELERLLQVPLVELPDATDITRLAALLAAAAVPSEAAPQPGEEIVLAAFREIVVEGGGVSSLAARRAKMRVAAVVTGSTLALLGGGVAAAATNSLPGTAQDVAHNVLSTIGVQVPGPNGHAKHPGQGGDSDTGDQNGTPPAFVPAVPSWAPANPPGPGAATLPHPSGVPTPGNSGTSRHHGNPTPAATTRPAPRHGKPSSPPIGSQREIHTHVADPRVMHRLAASIPD